MAVVVLKPTDHLFVTKTSRLVGFKTSTNVSDVYSSKTEQASRKNLELDTFMMKSDNSCSSRERNYFFNRFVSCALSEIKHSSALCAQFKQRRLVLLLLILILNGLFSCTHSYLS